MCASSSRSACPRFWQERLCGIPSVLGLFVIAPLLRAQFRSYHPLDITTRFFTHPFPENIHEPDIAIIWLLAIVSLVSLVPFTLGGFGAGTLGGGVPMKQCCGVPTESAVLLSLAMGTFGLIASVSPGGIALLLETFFGCPRANTESAVATD